MKHNVFILLSLLVLTGCDVINRYRLGDAVVKIGKEALYEADLERACAGLTGEDSAKVAEAYIQKWATEVLEYDKARTLVSNKQIESMVKEYERSLYINNYEQQLVNERMPKHVNADSVKAFYDRFPERFILKDNLLKGLLLVIHKDAPDQQNLKKWLGNLSDENMENIEKYAYQYASGYELFTEQWQRQSNVLLRLPIAQGNLSDLLKHNNQIEMQDSVSTYLLQVTEKRLAGERMPLEYAAPDIENIILSRRQVEFVNREKERIYRKAIQQDKIIFNQKAEKEHEK
ncbi:MAG: hypothetical protein IJ776_11475 [Paludibacteraceae bacterium]|nr:hypothetical protein [Paludibacteraceae bacterium]